MERGHEGVRVGRQKPTFGILVLSTAGHGPPPAVHGDDQYEQLLERRLLKEIFAALPEPTHRKPVLYP
jgi:hypothetical protein